MGRNFKAPLWTSGGGGKGVVLLAAGEEIRGLRCGGMMGQRRRCTYYITQRSDRKEETEGTHEASPEGEDIVREGKRKERCRRQAGRQTRSSRKLASQKASASKQKQREEARGESTLVCESRSSHGGLVLNRQQSCRHL